MVVVDLEGNVVEGKWNPSSDTPTHVALYKAFPADWRNRTHAFHLCNMRLHRRGAPCPLTEPRTRTISTATFPARSALTQEEIETAYEKNTGDGDHRDAGR